MALTPSIRTTQGQVQVGVQGGGDLLLTQVYAITAINFPAEEVRATQARIGGVIVPYTGIEVTQVGVLVLVASGIDNPRLRAWTFSLDGHDFYVLRLGETETIVCDLSTGQWSEWNSFDDTTWNAHVGQNWLSMAATTFDQGFTTNIVAGDDDSGVLWVLDPDVGVDDNPSGIGTSDFTRIVTGGVPMQMRETQRCNEVYLTLALGDPALEGANITLRTSDDAGQTWHDHGSITVTSGDYEQEVVWRSLGIIKAPGRVFEFSDTGVTVRISGVDMR